MDQNPRRDNFTKAKIEEPNPNLRLPKDLFPKPDSDLCYVKIFGFMEKFVQFSLDFCSDNTRKAQQEGETVASGDKLNRKVYRIRNKELTTVVGNNFEGMNEIQKVSEATIGILADAESNRLFHSFLDLVGTAQQVKTAELLILNEALKTYGSSIFPVILMPPMIYATHIIIPVHKVNQVLGNCSTNLLRMEMESGAWIKIEPGHPSSLGWKWRVVNVFGPQENTKKAKVLIQSVICSENEEVSAAGDAPGEMLHQLKEPTSVEIIGGKRDGDGKLSEEKKKQKLEGKQQVEESNPTSASGCYGSSQYGESHVGK